MVKIQVVSMHFFSESQEVKKFEGSNFLAFLRSQIFKKSLEDICQV